MEPLLDPSILEVILNTSNYLAGFSGTFINFAKGIGALCILVVVFQEGYEMMAKQKPFNLLFWIRPVILSMVISSWPAIPVTLESLCSPFENKAKSQYVYWENHLNALKEKKTSLLAKKWVLLLTASAELNASKNAVTGESEPAPSTEVTLNPSTWKAAIAEKFEAIKNFIINEYKLLLYSASSILRSALEIIGNIIWAIAIFCVLFAKELSIGFLIIFGPISFGMSVLDTWKDAWATWVTKFVSFQFYGFVAYLIMVCSLKIIELGLRHDVEVLAQDGVPTWTAALNGAYTLFGYLIGAFAMKMVPEIVSWIVPTNTSQAASHFSSGLAAAVAAPMAFVGSKMSHGAWNKLTSKSSYAPPTGGSSSNSSAGGSSNSGGNSGPSSGDNASKSNNSGGNSGPSKGSSTNGSASSGSGK